MKEVCINCKRTICDTDCECHEPGMGMMVMCFPCITNEVALSIPGEITTKEARTARRKQAERDGLRAQLPMFEDMDI